MSLTSRKITSFAKKVADLPDRPSPAYTPSQIKSQFDSSPEELRVGHNGLIDDLSSVTPGSSGAEQVGSAPITGVTGTTVYGQLSDIKTQIETNANNFGKVTVSGQSDVVADAKADTLTLAGGTGITVTTNPATDTVTITATGNATPGAHASSHITGGTDVIPNAVASGNAGLMSGADKAKLDNLTASTVSVADASNHFTATNVEGVLDELFQFANDGKTSIANVVGSPTLTSDTFTTISNNIQTQKANLATNLTAKGQTSTGSESLKALVDKVSNVSLGVWVSDWSAYQTVYNWAGIASTVTTSSYGTLLDVPSGAGVLTFVRAFAQAPVPDNPDVRITVDGIPYVFTGVSGAAGHSNGNLIKQPIHFKTSLKIEGFNRNTVSASIGCDYTYLLKSGTPDTAKQTLLMASSRREALQQTTSTTAVNIANITGAGYLLGLEFSGFYGTAPSDIYGKVVVDGVTKMNSRQLLNTGVVDFKMQFFEGPIRFTSSLQVQHYISAAGSTALSKVFYTLD